MSCKKIARRIVMQLRVTGRGAMTGSARSVVKTAVYRGSRINTIGRQTHHVRLHHRHHLRPAAFSHKCPVNRSTRSDFLPRRLPRRGTVRSSLRAVRDVRDSVVRCVLPCSKISSTLCQCCQRRDRGATFAGDVGAASPPAS